MSDVKPETIVESGIEFGKFLPDEVCYLEKSHLVKSFGDGLKRADFIWLKNRNEARIYLIEVKSGFPNPTTKKIPLPKAKPSQKRKQHWSYALHDKLVNAFTLCVASFLGQHPRYAHEFSVLPSQTPFSNWDIKFIVVFTQSPRGADWPELVQLKLRQRMLPFLKKWGLKDSVVKVVTATDVNNSLGLPIISSNHPSPSP